MSTHTTPEAAPGTACEHCDDSVAHEHLDVRAVVEAERARALRTAVVQTTLALAALLLAVLAGPADALVAAALAALGWCLVTALGLAVTGSLRRRSEPVALLGGALTAAAAAPLVALTVALLVSGTVAVAATAGWLVPAAAAELVRARAWRRILLEPGQAGEHARGRAVAARHPQPVRDVLAWVVPGVLLGLYVVVTAALPVLVVVLVPLNVVLAVARARTKTPAGRGSATG